MGVLTSPTFNLLPSGKRAVLATNYLGSADMGWAQQHLPDLYEKEFERYGNRSVASFLRLVSAEIPFSSDIIQWSEQGRLHPKFVNCTSSDAATADTATITVADTGAPNELPIRVGQTVMLSENTTPSKSNKAIVTAVSGLSVTVAYYETGGQTFGVADTLTMFIYGSEFKKGSDTMQNSVDPTPDIFENSPIIIKDHFEINGSDMAQVGWIEVETDSDGTGYLWYLKASHETRLRFEDYLETSMVEAVPMDNTNNTGAAKGSSGVFHSVADRGNVYAGAVTSIADMDTIVQRLDKQGAIEENVIFNNRSLSFDFDDMLAGVTGYNAGGTSYGLFDNSEQMALNLGFTGFRRGYDFYKNDWKYLNDASMRGGIVGGGINGLMVPAGSTTVYDMVLGKNAKRPYLHVRYRASETENRKYKTWVTGSAGGASNSNVDKMEINFLSERALCTMGANNFFLFEA